MGALFLLISVVVVAFYEVSEYRKFSAIPENADKDWVADSLGGYLFATLLFGLKVFLSTAWLAHAFTFSETSPFTTGSYLLGYGFFVWLAFKTEMGASGLVVSVILIVALSQASFSCSSTNDESFVDDGYYRR